MPKEQKDFTLKEQKDFTLKNEQRGGSTGSGHQPANPPLNGSEGSAGQNRPDGPEGGAAQKQEAVEAPTIDEPKPVLGRNSPVEALRTRLKS